MQKTFTDGSSVAVVDASRSPLIVTRWFGDVSAANVRAVFGFIHELLDAAQEAGESRVQVADSTLARVPKTAATLELVRELIKMTRRRPVWNGPWFLSVFGKKNEAFLLSLDWMSPVKNNYRMIPTFQGALEAAAAQCRDALDVIVEVHPEDYPCEPARGPHAQ